ncbi:MAG: phosphoribosylanthranilate isomerase [Candidatus Bathyarchaeota archaeon]
MTSVRVKICGLTREEDLAIAVSMGADAVGFLVGVPESPRNLTLKRAENLLSKVPIFIDKVVVTPPKSIEWLLEVNNMLKPSAIQIHGKNELDFKIIQNSIKDTRLIKTIYVTKNSLNKKIIEDLKTFDAILLDSFNKTQYGGTGKVHDWKLSRQIKKALEPIPVILAGGLTPDNIKEAILTVKPYAVDVASGVESNPGIKDDKKIRTFIENAKQINI